MSAVRLAIRGFTLAGHGACVRVCVSLHHVYCCGCDTDRTRNRRGVLLEQLSEPLGRLIPSTLAAQPELALVLIRAVRINCAQFACARTHVAHVCAPFGSAGLLDCGYYVRCCVIWRVSVWCCTTRG